MQKIKEFFHSIGELRTMLSIAAMFSLANVPFADSNVRMEGWGLVPDVLVPVVSSILVFVILLDMLMSRVFSIEASDEARARFKRIFRFELILVVSLIVFWSPYFITVLS